MNYFTKLTEECAKLDALGQAYLDGFEFIPPNKIVDRILKAARNVWEAAGGESITDEEWTALPEWVKASEDGSVPYSGPPNNGSLYYHLGFSLISCDAHLRNLLEIVEGREEKELDFPVLVDEAIMDAFVEAETALTKKAKKTRKTKAKAKG